MKKIHLKKIRKIKKTSKTNFIILLIIFIIISIILVFNYINKKISPILMKYAQTQSSKIATYVIRQSVNDEIIKKISTDDLFVIQKDNNDNIQTIDFNSAYINKMLNNITQVVDEYIMNIEYKELKKIGLSKSIINSVQTSKEEKGLIFEIPSGLVFQNSILANLGPKIPVKLNLIGDIESNIKTNVKNYGINNALIEVSVYLHATEQVILPIATKKISVEMNVPLAIKIIQGQIPEYYLSGLNTQSSKK